MATDVFRAAPQVLRRALPGWKEPLPEPVKRQVRNPFTGQQQDVWSWDPTPDSAVSSPLPLAPPGRSIDMAGFDLFGTLALVSLLLPGDASALRRALFSPDSRQANAYERKPALIGPAEGPWVWAIPTELTSRLAAMAEAEILKTGPRWAEGFRQEMKRLDPMSVDLLNDDFYTDGLRRLCAFAREASSLGETLFEWVSAD